MGTTPGGGFPDPQPEPDDEPDWENLGDSGYSDWEIQILQAVYSNGGQYGINGVWYIVNNNIHIGVGDQFHCNYVSGFAYSCEGDWQSSFEIGAWYDSENNYVFLNPGAGYRPGEMPDIYGLSNVIHEAIHIRQGPFLASTAYGELEAWQTGFRILDALNGDLDLSRTQQAIINRPLNLDPINLTGGVTLMLEDQKGKYLGGYLLYFTIPFVPLPTLP